MRQKILGVILIILSVAVLSLFAFVEFKNFVSQDDGITYQTVLQSVQVIIVLALCTAIPGAIAVVFYRYAYRRWPDKVKLIDRDSQDVS